MRTRKQKVFLTSLLVAIVIIPLAAYLISPREPSYQGKSLSAWIEPFCKETPTGLFAPAGPQYFEELQPVRRAVAQIGTNGVPALIARLEYRESTFKRTIRGLLAKQPISALRLADPRAARIRAIRALAILGPTARPAVPALATQLRDPLLGDHVIYALSGMGPAGMRALVNQFTNVGPSLRMQIATTLISPSSTYRGENVSRLEAGQIPADIMVEGLSRVVSDPTKFFQDSAICYRLGEIGPAASNAVPVLLKLVQERDPMTRHAAVRALGQIGAQPNLVIPVLTNLLTEPDTSTRMAAVFALREFGYQIDSTLSEGNRVRYQIRLQSTNSFR